MKLRFWGVRGSLPSPGKNTIRYGGNTSSIELRLANNELLIFDAGTGIRNLGDYLFKRGELIKAHLLITHPHWDHIQGFPFFKPAFIPGNELTILGTERPEKPLNEIISEQMNRIYFPVQLNDLKAKINFLPVKSEMTFEIYGASIRTLYVHHPGFTVGYRLEYKNKTLVYISDNEPFNPNLLYKFTNFEPSVLEAFRKDNNEPNKRIYDFCSGADVLIHDATYTPEEYAEKQGWGHSDYLFALNIAERSNIKRLYLFHHDHTHNDNKVDYILRRCRLEARKRDLKLRIEAASEGMKITI